MFSATLFRPSEQHNTAIAVNKRRHICWLPGTCAAGKPKSHALCVRTEELKSLHGHECRTHKLPQCLRQLPCCTGGTDTLQSALLTAVTGTKYSTQPMPHLELFTKSMTLENGTPLQKQSHPCLHPAVAGTPSIAVWAVHNHTPLTWAVRMPQASRTALLTLHTPQLVQVDTCMHKGT